MLAARYVWGTYCPTVALEFAVPASRAFWKGYLKLSFVSCPVALYPATSAAERVSFRQVNRRTGHRLRHKLVDSVTGEAVDSSNKARGYEVGENEFLLVEDRDLERARSERLPPGAVELAEPPPGASPPTVPAGLHEQDTEENGHDNEEADEIVPRPENTRTIEIERFLQAGQIDARYFEKPYYVLPREEIGQEFFAVIRDAMAREGCHWPRPCRVVLPRAAVLDRAHGQGPSRCDAAFFERSAQRRTLFQRDSADEAPDRDDEACPTHHQDEVGGVRSIYA